MDLSRKPEQQTPFSDESESESPEFDGINHPTAEVLRSEILSKVAEYAKVRWPEATYIPGKTPAPYAGRVFDELDVVSLVDSSLDFWLTSGRFSRQLEKELAAFVGVAHCRLVNSGSSANLVAFSTLTSPRLGERRVKRGDEVITVAAGFPTTVAPIVQYGAIPVFVDVDLLTDNIDITMLEQARSDRTKAVMIAHTLGNPFDLDAVVEFCNKYELWLIEDNCDALGSEYTSYRSGSAVTKRTGSFGHLSTTSFYPAHQMTTGEGGAVYTNDDELALIAESFRDWGRDCYCAPGRSNTCGKRFEQCMGELPAGYDHKYTYSHFGYNLKMTDMQAAIGVTQLAKLPGFVEARRSNYEYLKSGLAKYSNVLRLPEATKNSNPCWFGFLVSVQPEFRSLLTRDSFVAALEAARIQTRMLFAGNLTRQPCFDEMREENTGYRQVGSLENTDNLMNHAFWFGVYPGMTQAHLDHIIQVIGTHVSSAGIA